MTRLRLLLLIMYVLLIFFLSSRPYFYTPGPDFHLKDKTAHIAEYSILGALLFYGIARVLTRSKPIAFLFLFALGTSVGALDEMFQSYIPGRRMDVIDWVADAMGVALGVGFFMLIDARRLGGDRRQVNP